MFQRVLMVAAGTALISGAFCQSADQETFVRPNEADECATVDFLAYAEGLENTDCGPEQCEYLEQTATLFDMKYFKDYKVVEYKQSSELEVASSSGQADLDVAATYILYQCGTEEPNDEWIANKRTLNESVLHFVEIPLTAVATDDSTVGWMLEELGVHDRVRFGGLFSTSPCILMVATSEEEDGCGREFIGEFDMTGAELTNSTEYDALFGFESDVEANKILLQASADPGPLARAEHIVYLSAFFNVEARAMQWFAQVRDSYVDQAELVEDNDAAPTVAWITISSDTSLSNYVNPDGEAIEGAAVIVSFARYKTILTRDAGGALLSQDDVVNTTGAFASGDDIVFAVSEYATVADQQAALQDALQGVDVLIDESFVFGTYAVANVTAALGLNGADASTELYPFLGNDDVWRHDKAQTVTGNDDWFGEAVARPDFVHSDLKEIITPGSVPNHTFRFFRNLSEGEEVTMSSAEQCTTLTCAAYQQQTALTAGLTGDAAAADSTAGDADVEEEGSAGGQKLVAGAMIAAAVIVAML